MAIKLYEDCGVLAIWQTFAARIQNHPKVGVSLVLLETRERVAKVSPSFPVSTGNFNCTICNDIPWNIYIYNIRLPTGTRERGGLTFTHVQSSLPQNIIDSNNEKSVSMWILIPSFYIRTLSQVFTEPIWSIERSVNSLPLSFADCSLTKWGTRNCFAGSERVRRVFRSATFGADISP